MVSIIVKKKFLFLIFIKIWFKEELLSAYYSLDLLATDFAFWEIRGIVTSCISNHPYSYCRDILVLF